MRMHMSVESGRESPAQRPPPDPQQGDTDQSLGNGGKSFDRNCLTHQN